MKQKFLLPLLATVILLNVGTWQYLRAHGTEGRGVLTVAFLDIGQGDAIYIEAPNGKQMLVDGGPKSAVIDALSGVMPKGDTSIDIIAITNPDADHISGFNAILKQFEVGILIEPGTLSTTKTYKEVESNALAKNLPRLIAHKGMKIVLDEKENVVFEVLFPDRDVSGWTRNDGSLVGRLTYGTTSFMLMGDATTTTENAIMLRTAESTLKSTVLKLGHHGSRTSSGSAWLEVVAPDVAIISAGKNNTYGHPHKEVIDRLNTLHVPYRVTFETGTITFTSNGKELTEKTERTP